MTPSPTPSSGAVAPAAALPSPGQALSRVQLTPLTPQHAPALVEAVLEIATDPAGHSLWWVHPAYSLAEAHAFIARAVVQQEQNLGEVFAIEEDGVLLGLANAKSYDWVHGCFQGGYWLRPTGRGRGAASAALRQLALFEHARGMLRMELLIGHDNERSAAVAQRAGACYEGRLRNRLIVNDVRKDASLWAVWLPELAESEKTSAPASAPAASGMATCAKENGNV